MANLSESAIIRRLIATSATMHSEQRQLADQELADQGLPIYADYEGHRIQARFIEPTRVEIIDGPLAGQSFKTPTGAARAVVRQYKPEINDNRNGWTFWWLDDESGARRSLQSIRPDVVRSGRGSLRGRLIASDDWDSAEVNDNIAADFGTTP